MGIYNVEVTYPVYGDQMTAAEGRKWQRLNQSVDLAYFKARYYRDTAFRTDDPRLNAEMYGRYVRWSDRASAKAIALKKFCAEIDAKYAPKEVAL